MNTSMIDVDKTRLLDDLLSIYKNEITVIYAIASVWEQLKDDAKDKCAEDFDQALIARETILEELLEIKDAGINSDYYDISIFTIDQILLTQDDFVKDIYGLDVNSFLNIKPAKSLSKAK